MQEVKDVAAHEIVETDVVIEEVPAHADRNADTHDFDLAKRIVKGLGFTRCIVTGTTEDVQQHHALAEKCAEEGVDLIAFRAFLRALNFPAFIQTCYAIMDMRAANGGVLDEAKLNAQLDVILARDYSEEMKGYPLDSVDVWNQMLPISQQYHTGSGIGIHHEPFSIWILRLLEKPGAHLVPIDEAEYQKLKSNILAHGR